MKLKVSIILSSMFFVLNGYSEDVQLPWRVSLLQIRAAGNIYKYKYDIFVSNEEEAQKKAKQFFPLLIYFESLNQSYNRQEILNYISTNKVQVSCVPWYPDQLKPYVISNIVTGVTFDPIQIYDNSEYQFINKCLLNTRQTEKGAGLLLRENSLVGINYVNGEYQCLINFDAFVGNVINTPEILTSDLISKNIEIIKNYLLQIGSNSSDLLTIVEAIEMNQLNTQSTLGNILDKNAAITNLLYGISINSTYANNRLETIKTVAQTFAEDQRIKQLATGQIFSTLNPTTTGGSGGVIYEALDHLVRLNMLKQGVNITESELNTMSTSDKWTKSGMAAKYGSYSDNYDNRNIGIIVGTEAIKENENFQNKVNTLSQLADDNGNVVDPLTGELTKLTNAIKDWDKGKVDGALASYQYNNPAATNGLFGEIKRTLTEEGDWRLLDKGFKEKQDSFMDNITQDGVKVNTANGPIAVTVNNDDGLIVNFPDEVFQSKIFKTSNSTLDIWYDKWIDWKILWSNFTGVENHNDRGFLDIMLERNDLYYSYVTNKMYGTVSNQLARLIELNEYTNRQNFVDVPRSTYVRYLMRGIGTTENNDDDLFAIKDEPTFAFDGSTNFEQAVAFQLHDLFEVSQNGSKADMMSADFIRGIFQLLGTGSNIAVQVAYITNTVYKANGLSTDKNDYSSYEQEKEKLDADFTEFNDILEEIQEKTVEKINFVSYRVFADYTLPSSLTLLEFNNQKFEIDLNKWDKIFIMMHNCAKLAWLAVGLLMLPRVAYMLICFGLKMLGKFYGILTSK